MGSGEEERLAVRAAGAVAAAAVRALSAAHHAHRLIIMFFARMSVAVSTSGRTVEASMGTPRRTQRSMIHRALYGGRSAREAAARGGAGARERPGGRRPTRLRRARSGRATGRGARRARPRAARRGAAGGRAGGARDVVQQVAEQRVATLAQHEERALGGRRADPPGARDLRGGERVLHEAEERHADGEETSEPANCSSPQQPLTSCAASSRCAAASSSGCTAASATAFGGGKSSVLETPPRCGYVGHGPSTHRHRCLQGAKLREAGDRRSESGENLL